MATDLPNKASKECTHPTTVERDTEWPPAGRQECRLAAFSAEFVQLLGERYHAQHAERSRLNSLKLDSRLSTAHNYALLASLALTERLSGKAEWDQRSFQVMLRICAVLQGEPLVATAIQSCALVQASALVRQEMEALGAGGVLGAGPRENKRTPNVGVLDEELRRLYGPLSDAAHASHDGALMSYTTWKRDGQGYWSVFPTPHQDHAEQLFAAHIAQICMLAQLHLGPMVLDAGLAAVEEISGENSLLHECWRLLEECGFASKGV